MDSENMKRVGLYLDKDLVNRADDMVKQFHFKSRNEFFTEAVEYYIADYLLHSNEPAVSDKLGQAIAKYSEDNAKAISKGLFRYAVQLEMMCRVLAATSGIDNVPSPKKQTKNTREKLNEKNDKYDIKLLYSTAFIPRFA